MQSLKTLKKISAKNYIKLLVVEEIRFGERNVNFHFYLRLNWLNLLQPAYSLYLKHFFPKSSTFRKKGDFPVSHEDIIVYSFFFFSKLAFSSFGYFSRLSNQKPFPEAWGATDVPSSSSAPFLPPLFPTVFPPIILFPLPVFCPRTPSLFLSSFTKVLYHTATGSRYHERGASAQQNKTQFYSSAQLQSSNKSEVN